MNTCSPSYLGSFYRNQVQDAQMVKNYGPIYALLFRGQWDSHSHHVQCCILLYNPFAIQGLRSTACGRLVLLGSYIFSSVRIRGITTISFCKKSSETFKMRGGIVLCKKRKTFTIGQGLAPSITKQIRSLENENFVSHCTHPIRFLT